METVDVAKKILPLYSKEDMLAFFKSKAGQGTRIPRNGFCDALAQFSKSVLPDATTTSRLEEDLLVKIHGKADDHYPIIGYLDLDEEEFIAITEANNFDHIVEIMEPKTWKIWLGIGVIGAVLIVSYLLG